MKSSSLKLVESILDSNRRGTLGGREDNEDTIYDQMTRFEDAHLNDDQFESNPGPAYKAGDHRFTETLECTRPPKFEPKVVPASTLELLARIRGVAYVEPPRMTHARDLIALVHSFGGMAVIEGRNDDGDEVTIGLVGEDAQDWLNELRENGRAYW
jgi:hypothetical protein